ncbi:MAG: hypothetical protein K1X44_08900 [Alphaproteobacteria bacterium]|nr:hypothetical protein [Alphaproteobacteria bacterium]
MFNRKFKPSLIIFLAFATLVGLNACGSRDDIIGLPRDPWGEPYVPEIMKTKPKPKTATSSSALSSNQLVETYMVEGHVVQIVDRQTVSIDGMTGKEFDIDGHHIEVLGIDTFKVDGQVFYLQLPPPPRSKVTTAPKFQGSGNAAFTQSAPPPRAKTAPAVTVTAQNGQETTMFGAPPPRTKAVDTSSNNNGVAARDRQGADSDVSGDDDDR